MKYWAKINKATNRVTSVTGTKGDLDVAPTYFWVECAGHEVCGMYYVNGQFQATP